MGKHELRDDKECQNCGHNVEEIYCPHCGQKNTETRQSFGHLVTHFFEDLTHYDTAFWKTIKYLLFRPAKLTKEYLAGRKQAYVPPVKLYIFISFITFFILAILPADETPEYNYQVRHQEDETDEEELSKPRLDNFEFVWLPSITTDNGFEINSPIAYTSIRQMDSMEALKPDSLRLNSFEYKLAKNVIRLHNHYTPIQVGEKFAEKAPHNFSKTIFLYMPIFAFWLWLFHGKKRWYFFDHGIFTLHYFSFLLLTFCTIFLLTEIIRNISESDVVNITLPIIILLIVCWQIYYFYRAHRKMYLESKGVSFIKSSILFVINSIMILIMILFFFILTYHNLH